MKPVPFTGANVTLIAPGCNDLPALRGNGQIISTWEMTQDEVARLLNGGHVRLSILSENTHPPVMLWVE